jgi:hypothetical protein
MSARRWIKVTLVTTLTGAALWLAAIAAHASTFTWYHG